LLGHERIAFDEVLRIPWVMRAPFLIDEARKVREAVSSVDLTPTLLTLLGFDISGAGFDGADVLGAVADGRKVYFSGWMHQSPAGFVKGDRKFIYNPATAKVNVYNLEADPSELVVIEPAEVESEEIAEEITRWRKESIFRLDQERTGKKILYDSWLCRWNNRVGRAKYQNDAKN
jgi:arylsulfatase A-like enzyme